MTKKINKRTVFAFGRGARRWLVIAMLSLVAAPAFAQQAETVVAPPPTLSTKEQRAVDAFLERVRAYVALREGIENKLPKLSTQSTPEQIEAHETALEVKVRTARLGARRGEMFTPDVARHIRSTIKKEYRGRERVELRESVLEADTKGVALRVNYTYPEDKELVEMPPTLLLKLPQLPKQLRYRFVGRNMALVDRENELIIDYMLDALP